MEPIFWMILLVLVVIMEVLVPGPTSLWFGAGAITGGVISFFGGTVFWQWFGFIVVTVLIWMMLRPIIKKWKNTPPEKTNIDAFIGKVVQVIETIDNYEETGCAILEGKEWTARSTQDNVIIKEGSLGIVKEISGVKLILEQEREIL